jgi:hypothetical protein
LTAQGHPRAIFQRAIERGNLAVAETVLRAEIPRPTLVDLLELTALIAQKDPGRRGRVTTRWLQRWLESAPEAKIDEAAFLVASLQALGSANHVRALEALRDVAERASGGSTTSTRRGSFVAQTSRNQPG